VRDALTALGIIVGLFVFLLVWTRDESPGLVKTTIQQPELKIVDTGSPLEVARAKHAELRDADSERTQGARDPIQRVLVAEDTKSGVVVEVGSSTIGRMIGDCVGLGDASGPLAKLGGKVDLRRGVDRIAVLDGAVIFSGGLDELVVADAAKHGDRGQTFPIPGYAFPHGGFWKGEILIAASSEAIVKRTIDRLESRGPEGKPLIPEGEAYGNLYAVSSVGAIAQYLGQPEGANADQIAILHADFAAPHYQLIELPISGDKGSTEKAIAALLEGAKLDVETSDFEGGVRVEGILPEAQVRKLASSCRVAP
jgi:hypothetical protein